MFWIVLVFNIGLVVVFFVIGVFGDFSVLIVNGFDNFFDSFVYVISLFVLFWFGKWKCGVVNIFGGLLILFVVGIFYDVWCCYIGGLDLFGMIMIVMVLIVVVINVVCVWLFV